MSVSDYNGKCGYHIYIYIHSELDNFFLSLSKIVFFLKSLYWFILKPFNQQQHSINASGTICEAHKKEK